eukprot:9905596-Lingulodinium_polyedra.AAC.1
MEARGLTGLSAEQGPGARVLGALDSRAPRCRGLRRAGNRGASPLWQRHGRRRRARPGPGARSPSRVE